MVLSTARCWRSRCFFFFFWHLLHLRVLGTLAGTRKTLATHCSLFSTSSEGTTRSYKRRVQPADLDFFRWHSGVGSFCLVFGLVTSVGRRTQDGGFPFLQLWKSLPPQVFLRPYTDIVRGVAQSLKSVGVWALACFPGPAAWAHSSAKSQVCSNPLFLASFFPHTRSSQR
jgi:hypothetical protein